jgi:two-component system, LytTR family, sensor kinase
MAHDLNPRAHARSWLIIGVVWAVVAGVSTLFTEISLVLEGHHDLDLWPRFLLREVATWAFWVSLTPVLLRLVRRLPLIGPRWRRTVGIHIGIGLALTVVFNLLRFGENLVIGWLTQGSAVMFMAWSLQRTAMQFFIYLSVIAVGSAVDQEQRTAHVESLLLSAKLSALRAQLQPHFLFNTLHTIAMLVRERDTDEALRVVLDLSELLRRVVDDTDTEHIPLERELSFLERYVGIERARFDDAIAMTIDVDTNARDAAIPPLLLQPLVENALRHGMSSADGRGSVRVSARRQANRVTIDIVDDGPGYDSGRADAATGVGLRNTRERLAELYPNDHQFEIAPLVERGTRVRLVLPYHAAGWRA